MVRGTENRDPAPSVSGQGEGHVPRRGQVVDPYSVRDVLVDFAQQDHRRQGHAQLNRALVQHNRIENQAVDDVGAGFGHQLKFALRIEAGFFDLYSPAAFVRDFDHVVGKLRRVWGAEIRQRQPDQARTAISQTPGRVVRHVIEFLQRFFHPGARTGADRDDPRDHIGYCLRRNSRSLGHVLDRWSHLPTLPSSVSVGCTRSSVQSTCM